MTIVYRSDKGANLTPTEVDDNFHDLDDRVATLETAGGSITVTYSGNALTFHMPDDTTQGPFALPVLQLNPRGFWQNSTAYSYGDLVTARGLGLYLVLVDHTSPASPETFDPSADDGTTAHNPLYQLWAPLRDVAYDVVVSIPGAVPSDSVVLSQIVLPRSISMASGLPDSEFFMLTGPQATTLTLSLYKNSDLIGTVEFTAGANETDGSQIGSITFDNDVTFDALDIFRILAPSTGDVATTDGTQASDLSMTIVATRLDV